MHYITCIVSIFHALYLMYNMHKSQAAFHSGKRKKSFFDQKQICISSYKKKGFTAENRKKPIGLQKNKLVFHGKKKPFAIGKQKNEKVQAANDNMLLSCFRHVSGPAMVTSRCHGIGMKLM